MIRLTLLNAAAGVWLAIGLRVWIVDGDVTVPVICASIFVAAAGLEARILTMTYTAVRRGDDLEEE